MRAVLFGLDQIADIRRKAVTLNPMVATGKAAALATGALERIDEQDEAH
jgi:uracil phosphoribosyltransferase